MDPARGGSVRVPPIDVDNVQVRPDPQAPLEYWRPERVPTNPGSGGGPYCLNWRDGYDTWRPERWGTTTSASGAWGTDRSSKVRLPRVSGFDPIPKTAGMDS